MYSRIEEIQACKLLGKSLPMSLSENRTFELWREFMPLRNQIINTSSDDLYSVQVYPPDYDFVIWDVHASFTKYAMLSVHDFENIPPTMETLIIEGLYAVFIHKGSASEGEPTFRYIFEQWLPHSDYELDARPHFEILGNKYKNNDPSSQEEVWIPIKKRKPKASLLHPFSRVCCK